jgi:hypothetical protein
MSGRKPTKPVFFSKAIQEKVEKDARLAKAAVRQAPYKIARAERARKARDSKRKVRVPTFGYGPAQRQVVFAPARVHGPARVAGIIPGGGGAPKAVPAEQLRLLLARSEKDIAKNLKVLLGASQKVTKK